MQEFLPFISLALGIISLFGGNNKKIPLGFIVTSFLLALITQTMTAIGAIFTLIFIGFCWLYFNVVETLRLKFLVYFALVALGMGFVLHIVPGFNNVLIFKQIQLSSSSAPFNIYLNFDKGIMGLILAFFVSCYIKNNQQLPIVTKPVLLAICGCIGSITFLGLISGYVAFDLTLSPLFFIWGAGNLVFTCVAEEFLFRGLIQQSLTDFFEKYQINFTVPLFLSSLIFGFVHYKGGLAYMGLATIAGLFYGYAYYKTKRVESAILVHFCLNASHFLFFTYPCAVRLP